MTTYTDLANTLAAQWLSEFTYSEAYIARLRELNSPTVLIQAAMTPHLNSQHEIIIYWLKELDKPGADAKSIRRQLRANGFSLQERKIVRPAD